MLCLEQRVTLLHPPEQELVEPETPTHHVLELVLRALQEMSHLISQVHLPKAEESRSQLVSPPGDFPVDKNVQSLVQKARPFGS